MARRTSLVTYFPTYALAVEVCGRVREYYPEARVVRYARGWAVQYYKSGPYYPEAL